MTIDGSSTESRSRTFCLTRASGGSGATAAARRQSGSCARAGLEKAPGASATNARAREVNPAIPAAEALRMDMLPQAM
jgi:hypothetical protein